MSGRWRSRHWKAGEGGDDADGGGRRRPRDARDLSRERPHDMNKNNNNGWSRDRGDDGQLQYNRNNAGRYSRRDDEYQQPQRHQPTYNNNSSSTPQHSEGEWRRGQALPASNNSRAGERMPPGNNGHQRTKQGPASNNRPVATGGSSRPVFSAPPKQAWGSVNGSDKHPSQTKDAKNIPEKKVWAKPVDSNNSNNTGTTANAKTNTNA